MTQEQWLQLNMKFLLGFMKFLEFFSFSVWVCVCECVCVCVCVCGVWRGANVQLAEGGHLWSSPAGKTLQEKLLNM